MIRFERKIAEQGIKPVNGASVEPTKEQRGGDLTIGGGELEMAKENHKDWGQVIAKDLEIPADFHTMTYQAATQATINVPVGDVGYVSARASGNCSISITKPKPVPEEMWLPKDAVGSDADRHRYRMFRTALYIYYAGPTQLSLSGDIQYGFDGYKLVHTPAPPPAAETPPAEGEEDPIAETPDPNAGPVPEYALEKLFKHYTEEQREAGTADLFLITYDERIGRAIISPLALGQPNAADPQNPVDKDDDPPDEDEDGEEDDLGDREDDPMPPDEGENVYVDEDGNVLVPTPPPSRPGSPPLIALHRAGLSISLDGGARWMYRQVRGLTEDTGDDNGAALGSRLVDIAGTRKDGVWLLCADGTVMHARTPTHNYIERKVGDAIDQEVELPLTNAGFEIQDLEGTWTLKSGDMPLSMSLEDPPQRPGSTRYLVSSGPGKSFRVEQPIIFTEFVRSQFEAIGAREARVEADIYLDPGAEAVVSIGKPYTYVRPATNHSTLGWQFGALKNGRHEDSTVFLSQSSSMSVYIYPIEGTMTPSGTMQRSTFSAGARMRISWSNEAENMVFRLSDVDNGQILRFAKSDVLDYRAESGKVFATEDGDFIEFRGQPGDASFHAGDAVNTWLDLCVRKNAEFITSAGDVRFVDSPWRPSGDFDTFTALGSATATGVDPDPEQTDASQNWQKIQFDFKLADLAASGYYIAIEGKGTGTVYYDNVRIYAGMKPEGIKAIATTWFDKKRGVDLYDDETHWALRAGAWTGDPDVKLVPTMAVGGETASEFNHAVATDSAVSLHRMDQWSAPISSTEGALNGMTLVSMFYQRSTVDENGMPIAPGNSPGMIGGPFFTTSTGSVLYLGDDLAMKSAQKYEQSVTSCYDPRREALLLTQGDGAIETLSVKSGVQEFVAQKRQPINAHVVNRRSLVTQRGMIFGYSTDFNDFCWTEDPSQTWKFGGGFGVKVENNSDPFFKEEEPPADGGVEPPVDEEPTDPDAPAAPVPASVEEGTEETTDPETPPPTEPEDPKATDPTAPTEGPDGLLRYPILKLFELR